MIGVTTEHHFRHCLWAEIFLLAKTVEALTTWGRRRGHQGVANAKISDPSADLGYHPGKLMAERRRHQPHRMATAKRLEISPAAQRALNLEQNFTRPWARRHNLAQFEAVRLDQHRLARRRTLRGSGTFLVRHGAHI
jgi:hypothetical protein